MHELLTAFDVIAKEMLDLRRELNALRTRVEAIEKAQRETAVDVDTADAVEEFRLEEIHARLAALENCKS